MASPIKMYKQLLVNDQDGSSKFTANEAYIP